MNEQDEGGPNVGAIDESNSSLESSDPNRAKTAILSNPTTVQYGTSDQSDTVPLNTHSDDGFSPSFEIKNEEGDIIEYNFNLKKSEHVNKLREINNGEAPDFNLTEEQQFTMTFPEEMNPGDK